MTDPVDTSAEAVEAMARAMLALAPDGYADNAGVSARVGGLRTAATTLRALAAERDALRAALRQIEDLRDPERALTGRVDNWDSYEEGIQAAAKIARAVLKGDTP